MLGESEKAHSCAAGPEGMYITSGLWMRRCALWNLHQVGRQDAGCTALARPSCGSTKSSFDISAYCRKRQVGSLELCPCLGFLLYKRASFKWSTDELVGSSPSSANSSMDSATACISLCDLCGTRCSVILNGSMGKLSDSCCLTRHSYVNGCIGSRIGSH